MRALPPKLTDAVPLDGWGVHLEFADGLAAQVDLSYLLEFGGVFEPLRDPAFFRQMFIDGPTIAWPNEADIAPETLYNHAQRAEYELRPDDAPRSGGSTKGASLTRATPWAGMPAISRFNGITIRMFFNEDLHPGRPHFHAIYAGEFASFAIEDLERLVGSLPPRVERLVKKWSRAHREELMMNWKRGREGLGPVPIEPLA